METELSPALEIEALKAQVQQLLAQEEAISRRADETNGELIKNLDSLQERHGTLSGELSSTRQELHDCQRRFEEIRQENIKLQQRQEETDAATVTLRREQASLQRTLESKEARLTTALAESDALVAANRKLIKEEADARTAAERARYEAAAASASCEHAVQDRQILEERLQVVQQRAKEADAAREQSAKQLRDANAALSADCEHKVAEAARVQAVNSRLQGDNDKLHDEANVLKDKLREKESELTSVFEACEAEKSAYDAARASANERYQGELERKTELESTVRELSVMVEQLKESEQERMNQLTVERDDALEVARKAEEHSRSLSTAARGGLLEAPITAPGTSQQRAPLAPLLDMQGSDVDRGALITAPSGQQQTYTSLMHELEITKRKCREQAHELSQMSREYDEAMAILRARAVDLDVQRKQFNSMRSQHKALNASVASLADDKARAESAAINARARAESAGRHAALAAEAANDRARAMASLMVEVARLKGLPEPAREAVPFPNVAEMGGGVEGWDKEAQALVMDEKQMGSCTSVDAAIAMNMRLCATLRAILVDANVQRTKLADEKENELVPQLQAKGKEVESLSNIMKEKDDLMAQKQRQIDSLLAAIGARPAATGQGNTSDSQRVAIERVKEKMKEEAQKLEEMHASQRNHLEDALAKSRDSLLAARSDATTKAAEAQYSNDRAAAAIQQVTRLQSDLDSARSALSKTQEKLLETHQALTDLHSETATLRARTVAAEGDVEGARKAAAMAEAASTAAEDRCGAAQVKAAQAEGERMAAEKMLKALQTSFDSQSERLHKLMETRDEEAGSLRADVAAAREELHQARTTLADTSAKDKAERLEAEVSEIRVSLKEKDASINQIKAEAAAATSVKVELERQIESLRRQLADAQAGSTIHTAPSSISGEAADGASGAAAAAASGAARDAALLAAELRTTQVQLQHVMHERQAAHSLAEQHKSSAESLERHRDALGKTVTELRSAKEEAEKLAGEELTTKQELIEELNTQIAQLRTSTAAAEAKRMDAQRREQASLDEARRWRNDTEGLREKLRRQDMAASREAAEASSREAAIAAKHDSLTIQAGEYVQRIQALQREMTAAEETLKSARAEVRDARDASRREADAAAADITKLTADLADARAAGHRNIPMAPVATGGTAASAGGTETGTPGLEGGAAESGGVAGTSVTDADGATAAQDAEEARAAPAHSTGELRRLLREREADLRAAMGEAQAGRAQVRRLNTQLQAVNAQKEELRVAKVALEEKVAAPVLSESAQRQSVESTRQYETQRAANERLLEEKENLNRNLSKLREEKGGVEQRLRNANQDLTKSKRQLEIAKADLQECQKQSATWQQEARDCVTRYGNDDQKTVQSLRDTVRNLEETLQAAHADVQREKKVQEGLTREKTRLEKELDVTKKAAEKSSRAPIAFQPKSTQPAVAVAAHGGAGTSVGAVPRPRPGAQTAKEKEEKAQLQAELTKAKEELQSQDVEMKATQQKHQEEISKLEKRLQKLEAVSRNMDRLGWKDHVKTDAQGKKSKMSSKDFVDSLLPKLNIAQEAEGKVNELTEKVSEQEKAAAESAAQITKLSKECSTLKARINTLQKQSETQSSENMGLKKRISELETSRAAAPVAAVAPITAIPPSAVASPAVAPAADAAPVDTAGAPVATAVATPTRAKRHRDEAATPDVPAADAAVGATLELPAAQSTPKKLKTVKPATEDTTAAASTPALAVPVPTAAVTTPVLQPVAAATGAAEPVVDAAAAAATAAAAESGAEAAAAAATAAAAESGAEAAAAAEATTAAAAAAVTAAGTTVDEEMEEEEEEGEVGEDGVEEEGEEDDKVGDDGDGEGDVEEEVDADEDDGDQFEEADEEEDEAAAAKDAAATPEPGEGDTLAETAPGGELAAEGQEEADEKLEDEGQDASHEAAEEGAAAAEGAAAGADEAAEEAEGGEGADVPMEDDAALDAAGKEGEQNDTEGAAGQEPAEAEGGKAGKQPKKKAKKPAAKPTKAGKAKTKTQSDKGAAGKRKPALIQFPNTDPPK